MAKLVTGGSDEWRRQVHEGSPKTFEGRYFGKGLEEALRRAQADSAFLAARGLEAVAQVWDEQRGLLTVRYEGSPTPVSPPAAWEPPALQPGATGHPVSPPPPATAREPITSPPPPVGAQTRKPLRLLGALTAAGTVVAALVLAFGLDALAPRPHLAPREPTGAAEGGRDSRGAAGAASSKAVPVECRFEVPIGVVAECGDLIVPEDRRRPEGRLIRLHYAVFPSEAETPAPDPVVYLHGGPGGGALEQVAWELDAYPFLADRDLIVFDQRGSGFSTPSLDCPEITEAETELLDEDRDVGWTTWANALEGCRDRLRDEGIDLDAYDTDASAADVEDLRRALGIERWNLYGISYGTRLALTVMRDHPEAVRSVILDSVALPQADLLADLARNAQGAFNRFFTACRRDSDCDRDFPELKATFTEAISRLDEETPDVEVLDPDGARHDANIYGEDLVGFLFHRLYETASIPRLPGAIAQIDDGEHQLLAAFLAEQLEYGSGRPTDRPSWISEGVWLSVTCAEEAPFTNEFAIADAGIGVPGPIYDYFDEPILDICDLWGVERAADDMNEATRSELPSLLLAGEFDPITPPEWTMTAAKTLPRSHAFLFPGVGHGVLPSTSCAHRVARTFLAAPEGERPDASCTGAAAGVRFLPRDLVMRDDFSEPLSGWGKYEEPGLRAGYRDGAYRAEVTTIDYPWYGFPYPPVVESNARVEVDVTWVKAQAGHVGVVCGWKEPFDHFVLAIGSDGRYKVERWKDDVVKKIDAGRAPRQRSGDRWRMSAVCETPAEGPGRARLWLDGTLVADVDIDAGWGPGEVGLILEAGGQGSVDVLLDDFVVRRR